MTPDHLQYFIGLMSGTSLDGVDGVLLEWRDSTPSGVSFEHDVSPSVSSGTRDPSLRDNPNYFPQGGFEPPQADPESAVLPLHNRGMPFGEKESTKGGG